MVTILAACIIARIYLENRVFSRLSPSLPMIESVLLAGIHGALDVRSLTS